MDRHAESAEMRVQAAKGKADGGRRTRSVRLAVTSPGPRFSQQGMAGNEVKSRIQRTSSCKNPGGCQGG